MELWLMVMMLRQRLTMRELVGRMKVIRFKGQPRRQQRRAVVEIHVVVSHKGRRGRRRVDLYGQIVLETTKICVALLHRKISGIKETRVVEVVVGWRIDRGKGRRRFERRRWRCRIRREEMRRRRRRRLLLRRIGSERSGFERRRRILQICETIVARGRVVREVVVIVVLLL